jgi:DNA repair protein RadC
VSLTSDTLLQRVRASGVAAASPVDLVAVGFSRWQSDVPLAEAQSRALLTRYGSIRAVAEAAFSDLSSATGLEEFEILRALALIELGRRSAGAGKGDIESIGSAQDVMNLLDYLRFEKREHFVAILLNAKNGVMRVAHIHIGTLTMSVVGAREVFREAIRDGASSIIVAHNHPSGDPTPSPEDIEVTKQLVEAGKLLDIQVLDHVIIGERRYTSLHERGLIG